MTGPGVIRAQAYFEVARFCDEVAAKCRAEADLASAKGERMASATILVSAETMQKTANTVREWANRELNGGA